MIDSPLVDTVHAEFEHLLMKVMLCLQKTFSQIFSTFDIDKLGKIRGHHRKERLKISIVPQSCEILQTFVQAGGGTNLPPTMLTSVNFLNFVELYPLLYNLASLLMLRRFFQWCWRIFPNLSTSKLERTMKRSITCHLTFPSSVWIMHVLWCKLESCF